MPRLGMITHLIRVMVVRFGPDGPCLMLDSGCWILDGWFVLRSPSSRPSPPGEGEIVAASGNDHTLDSRDGRGPCRTGHAGFWMLDSRWLICFYARPHPGLLPREKEKLLPRLGMIKCLIRMIVAVRAGRAHIRGATDRTRIGIARRTRRCGKRRRNDHWNMRHIESVRNGSAVHSGR